MTPEKWAKSAQGVDPFVSTGVCRQAHGRSWAIRAQRIETHRAMEIARVVGTLALIGATVYAVLNVGSIKLAFTLAVSGTSGVVYLDGLHLIDRFYSRMSRTAMVLQAASVLLAVWIPGWRTVAVCVTVVVVGFIYIKVWNDSTLAGENWLMSDIGVKAIQLDDSGEADNVWQAHAAYEVRSTLITLGYAPQAEQLETMAKTVFKIGFETCRRLHIGEAADAEEMKRLRAENSRLKRTLGEAKAQLDGYCQELMDAKNDYSDLLSSSSWSKDRIRQLEDENGRLRAEVEEWRAGICDEDEQDDENAKGPEWWAEQEEEARIKEMHRLVDNGMTVAAAGKRVGWDSRTTAHRKYNSM